MADAALEHFALLKAAIRSKAERHLGVRKELGDWSLQDIRDFQADLEAECKSSVSEKWFYTYFKNDAGKLPRIDVLNLLSAWVGYRNWDDFTHAHPRGQRERPNEKTASKKQWWPWVIVFAFAASAGVMVRWMDRDAPVAVQFVDAYTREAIAGDALMVSINGAIVDIADVAWQQGDTLRVDGPYYKPRTFVVNAISAAQTVEVFPDDYALMLNFFSRSTADDLDKRRAFLMEAIHPNARIFQSHPEFSGLEMLNREEFIDRLLLPLNSLRNLEVQHIEYTDDRIFRLQFIQMQDDERLD